MSVRETILDGLVTAFETAVKGDDRAYQAGIKQVSRFDENLLTKKSWESPLVMFVDTGEEVHLVQDITSDRFAAALYIRGFVKEASEAKALEALNNVIADVKRFLNSEPSVCTEMLAVRYVGSEANRFDADKFTADCIIGARVVYVCTRGTY